MTSIVVLNDTAYVNGGAAKVAIASAIALKRMGADVEFFAGCGPVDTELAAALPVTCLEQSDLLSDPNRLRAAARGLANGSAARALRVVLARKSATKTVVHLHSWTKSLSATVVQAARSMGFPVVLTLHDYFIACPNGAFLHFGDRKICERRPLGPSCLVTNCDARRFSHKVWRVARTLVQNRFLRLPENITHFITPSDFCHRIISPWLPRDARVLTIANPIDVQMEPPANVSMNEKLLFAGRLAPEKGVLLLAECANRLDLSVLYVGAGPLVDRIRELHRRAEILPWADKEQLRKIMAASKALVFPSLWYEAVGILPFEAMARGLPVVVSKVCAASESVLDNSTGLHFDSSNPDDLCDKLIKISNAKTASQLGLQAYQRYWDDPLTIEKHASRLLQLYDSL